jgi:hypothetical protein
MQTYFLENWMYKFGKEIDIINIIKELILWKY